MKRICGSRGLLKKSLRRSILRSGSESGCERLSHLAEVHFGHVYHLGRGARRKSRRVAGRIMQDLGLGFKVVVVRPPDVFEEGVALIWGPEPESRMPVTHIDDSDVLV